MQDPRGAPALTSFSTPTVAWRRSTARVCATFIGHDPDQVVRQAGYLRQAEDALNHSAVLAHVVAAARTARVFAPRSEASGERPATCDAAAGRLERRERIDERDRRHAALNTIGPDTRSRQRRPTAKKGRDVCTVPLEDGGWGSRYDDSNRVLDRGPRKPDVPKQVARGRRRRTPNTSSRRTTGIAQYGGRLCSRCPVRPDGRSRRHAAVVAGSAGRGDHGQRWYGAAIMNALARVYAQARTRGCSVVAPFGLRTVTAFWVSSFARASSAGAGRPVPFALSFGL